MKSKKIRLLRAKGLSVPAVAKKVGVSTNYVYTLEWKDKHKGGAKKAHKTAKPKGRPKMVWPKLKIAHVKRDLFRIRIILK